MVGGARVPALPHRVAPSVVSSTARCLLSWRESRGVPRYQGVPYARGAAKLAHRYCLGSSYDILLYRNQAGAHLSLPRPTGFQQSCVSVASMSVRMTLRDSRQCMHISRASRTPRSSDINCIASGAGIPVINVEAGTGSGQQVMDTPPPASRLHLFHTVVLDSL